MDPNIRDAIRGGTLVDKTPTNTRSLIENMSINSKQFTIRSNSMVLIKGVDEIQVTNNKNSKSILDELTSLVKKVATSQTQTTRVCGICTFIEHPPNTCLT